ETYALAGARTGFPNRRLSHENLMNRVAGGGWPASVPAFDVCSAPHKSTKVIAVPMRRYLIAGNWKMNLDRASAVALAEGVVAGAAKTPEVELAVCPPSVYLEAVGEQVQGSPVALGAQNMYHEA